MKSIYLKAKIHGARLTDKKLKYDGSIEVDLDILEKAGIGAYEQVHVLNFDNGVRFVTYTLPGERGSKVFALAGPAARLGEIGDKIIVIAYGMYDDDEVKSHKPRVVIMDENNNIREE